ncbi:hypothetical protein N7513_000450 [Penicillium frequentans]|nr:hypothetical protein N7513_000450 [Penicillium glabrum]
MSASTPEASPRFRCEFCPKEFSRRENVYRHARIHCNVDKHKKLHRCPVCGKEFTRSDARQRHEAIHKTQQTRTESPKDLAVFSPQTSDTLHEAASVKTHNDDGSASLSSLNVRSLAENDVQRETGNSWSPMHSLNIGIHQTNVLTAQAPTENAHHWTNQSVENTFDDDLLRWIREPCLFEDMRFDEDIMAVLLETGSMPPFNAAPILAMDIDNEQMAIDHSNQNINVSIDGGGIMSRPASPQMKRLKKTNGHTNGTLHLKRLLPLSLLICPETTP